MRERPEDIPLLSSHFFEKYAHARRPRPRFSRDAYDYLESYPWPGNVRELQNLVRVLLVECEHDEVRAEDLPARFRPAGETGPRQHPSPGNSADFQTALHATVATFEEEYIRSHVARNEGNISKTAAEIGLSRVALHKKLKQYGIEH